MRIAIGWAVLVAGCAAAPGASDAGRRVDAWTLPPIEYETCPAQCVAFCAISGDRPLAMCGSGSIEGCDACVARCPVIEDGGSALAHCADPETAACRGGEPVACVRRVRD
jgi:hypothetical protein